MNFKDYKFRASQCSLIAAGTIGLTQNQKDEMVSLATRKSQAALGELDEKGKPVKPLTAAMSTKLSNYIEINKAKELPKTMRSELRKIARAEKFKRNFVFTNKYVQKGLREEQEATTVYQKYREIVLGIKGIFIENRERFYNENYTGMPDIFDTPVIEKRKEGFDTKCSWSLETFPFSEDDLDDKYEWQNQVYMNLTGLKKWTTAYVLVNISEDGLHKEKQKWYYALRDGATMPDEEDSPYKEEYIKKCHELERMLIFDYDRFVEVNPYHEMTITRDEWYGEGYDIPLKDRVCEKVSIYDPEKIKELDNRVEIAREYMNSLFGNFEFKSVI